MGLKFWEKIIMCCVERGLCVGITYLSTRVYYYTRVARSQDGVEDEHDGSGAMSGCERNGKKPLRSSCCTV